MAWTKIEGEKAGESGQYAPVQKWTMVGQSIEGEYVGTREGKYGPLGILKTPDGEVAFGMHKKILADKMSKAQVGDLIKVEYLGKRRSQAGIEYSVFEVYVDKSYRSGESSDVNTKIEFDILVAKIRSAKGDQMADSLKAVAEMSGNPRGNLDNLRKMAAQIGVA